MLRALVVAAAVMWVFGPEALGFFFVPSYRIQSKRDCIMDFGWSKRLGEGVMISAPSYFTSRPAS